VAPVKKKNTHKSNVNINQQATIPPLI